MPLIVGAWCECASEPKGCNEKSGVGMRPALAFVRAICCAHIRDHPTAPRSPRQNGYVERLIGSIRREYLDHIVVFGEAHLRRILAAYATYYNDIRRISPSARTRRSVVLFSGLVRLLHDRSSADF